MSGEKFDLLAVALLIIVAVFLIAVGLLVAWQTKKLVELFKYLSMASFIVLAAYVYHELHIGENDAWRWEK